MWSSSSSAVAAPAASGSSTPGGPGAPPREEVTLVEPRTIVRWLAWPVVIIAALHSLSMVARFALDRHYVRGLVPLTDLDVEQSIGTWYSGMLWVVAAGLIALIARAKRRQADRFAWAWTSLTGLCIYLSADELISVHELLNEFTNGVVPRVGPFYWTWVVAGAAIAAVVGLVYLRFALSLQATYRNGFIGAAVLFLGGALGFEMIEGMLWEAGHGKTALYSFCVLLEETLEQAGILLAIHTLLRYLAWAAPALSLRFVAPPAAAERR